MSGRRKSDHEAENEAVTGKKLKYEVFMYYNGTRLTYY